MFLIFIEHFNGTLKSRYVPQVCDWDAEDHKAGVNNHANIHGALNVTVTYLTCQLTTHAPSNYDKH